VKAENALAVQMAIPVIAGQVWHDKAISWLLSIGITPTDTHDTHHSADAIITLPGRPDMRILLDFKAGTLANKGPNLIKLGEDFHALSTGGNKCDFAMLMFQHGRSGKLTRRATHLTFITIRIRASCRHPKVSLACARIGLTSAIIRHSLMHLVSWSTPCPTRFALTRSWKGWL